MYDMLSSVGEGPHTGIGEELSSVPVPPSFILASRSVRWARVYRTSRGHSPGRVRTSDKFHDVTPHAFIGACAGCRFSRL